MKLTIPDDKEVRHFVYSHENPENNGKLLNTKLTIPYDTAAGHLVFTRKS
jgi:hypothetical protein